MGMRAGVDLGGTKVQVAIVDDAGRVHGASRHPTPTSGGPKDVIGVIVEAVRQACADAGADPGDLTGIGVGSPGDVDDAAGTVTSARNLPGWTGSFDVRSALDAALGADVALGNDVNVATMAEAELGAGRPYDSMLGVFWGTGVG